MDWVQRHPRYRTSFHAMLVAATGGHEVRVLDLSESGAFLGDAPPLLRGTVVRLAIDLGGERVASEATVMHALDPGRAALLGRAMGVGVAFAELGPFARGALLRAILSLESRDMREHGALPGLMPGPSSPLPVVLDAIPPRR